MGLWIRRLQVRILPAQPFLPPKLRFWAQKKKESSISCSPPFLWSLPRPQNDHKISRRLVGVPLLLFPRPEQDGAHLVRHLSPLLSQDMPVDPERDGDVAVANFSLDKHM